MFIAKKLLPLSLCITFALIPSGTHAMNAYPFTISVPERVVGGKRVTDVICYKVDHNRHNNLYEVRTMIGRGALGGAWTKLNIIDTIPDVIEVIRVAPDGEIVRAYEVAGARELKALNGVIAGLPQFGESWHTDQALLMRIAQASAKRVAEQKEQQDKKKIE